jgi:hypothetical protein
VPSSAAMANTRGTKAVQQVILRHGDATSQLDLAVGT